MDDNGDSNEESILPTTEKSKTIQAINKQTVHQICSGQVVLNIATAVKELVENSLDAGSTAIEIRLKEYGKESIEVSDNGYGVEAENFQALTLKHHTSKLRDYSDLIGVSTFGFRGEALSSLCALSNLVITTRHKSVECGTRIEFDHNGIIVKKSPCARQIGTTVLLTNIFSTLPVRQKEFHKNIKREFNKMAQLLYAYCLVASHAKITCSNQNKGYGRTMIVTTQGNKTLRENIVSVFGSKQLQGLLDIKPLDTFYVDTSDSGNMINDENKKNPFKFEGIISSCDHDCGRSTTDRQFYYINSRPCEPTKIIKVVNEIYRQFNVNQSPFVFLNVKVEHQDVDVNVTPDKRQIFLNNEKLLIALLKQTLTKLFENIPSKMKFQNKSLDTSNFNQLTFVGNSLNNMSKKSPLKKDSNNSSLKRKISFLERFTSNTKNLKLSHDVEEKVDEETIANTQIEGTQTPNLSSDSEEDTGFKTSKKILNLEYGIISDNEPVLDNSFNNLELSYKNNPIFMPKNVNIFHEMPNTIKTENGSEEIHGHESDSSSSEFTVIHENSSELNSNCENTESNMRISKPDISPDGSICESDSFTPEFKVIHENSSELYSNCENTEASMWLLKPNISTNGNISDYEIPDQDTKIQRDIGIHKINRTSVEMKCSIELVKSRMKEQIGSQKTNIDKLSRIKFRSEIVPSSNESAEKELDREISKEMFSKMVILGQFNLGFIIVQLEDDLFIIDQHASDEKYNFENLQKTTILQNQKLVVPQNLELTAMNESILIDNLDVFERNGFEFQIDGNADTTKRIKLIGIPMSKNLQFGKEDIDELLFMLQDSSGDNLTCRPSRVRSMLASRACRKSVMVGTPMTKTDMKKLVDNMGTMEQPWNCPHGRPTMRHLINLYLLNQGSED